MKIAIIADVHGNLPALEAVLADLDKLQPDEVIVNGDHVNRGPDSVAVMQLLLATGFKMLLGNHDALITMWLDRDPSLPGEWFDDPFWRSTDHTAKFLQDAGLSVHLRELAFSHQISLPNMPKILVAHASPRHYREGFGRFTPAKTFDEVISQHPADVYVGSHTHRPWQGTRQGRAGNF